ncbi:MAG TPA: ParA family protein [Candidatus Dormibacteraeota bacterium]|nr:ParA family protein [Candidatus Dormibacteraeota bacterium]
MSGQPWRIAIVAGKGGVGKTTSVINIGACLAGLGRRVLVVDCDPQSNLTSGLGFDPYEKRRTIIDVVAGRCAAQRAIVETATRGLHLLPAHPDLTAVEAQLPTQIGSVLRLRDALEEMEEDSYDAVLFDTPPNFQFHTISALAAARYALVPLQMSAFALRGLKEVLRVLAASRRRLNAELELLGVAPTFVSNTNFSRDLVDALGQNSAVRVFDTEIPMTVKLQESALHGTPVSVCAPKSSAARGYAALTAEILVALQDDPESVRIAAPAPPVELWGSTSRSEPAPAAVQASAPVGPDPEEWSPAGTVATAAAVALAEEDGGAHSDDDWRALLDSVRAVPPPAPRGFRLPFFGRRQRQGAA